MRDWDGYPGDALIDEANCFRELAAGPVGQWVIAHAHEIEGLTDSTVRAIRRVRENGSDGVQS